MTRVSEDSGSGASDGEPGAAARDVVAIDGPSGAGKSTVSRTLAARLGFAYLDTGAMYRAVTWHLLEHQFTAIEDDAALEHLLADLRLELTAGGHVLVNGKDVTAHLRSREVESFVSAVSARPAVRRKMRTLQRAIAARGPIVAEGRDMASVVFPQARWKVFLDAEPEERARRRLQDLQRMGRDVSHEEVLEELAVRDRLDSTRRDAPLQRSRDAIYHDTSGQEVDDVVAHLLAAIRGGGDGDPSEPSKETGGDTSSGTAGAVREPAPEAEPEARRGAES